MSAESEQEESRAGGAHWVAAGILLSRIAGLVRVRVMAQYLSTSLYADAISAALRLPNALQNLLGEGTLSASFIPVYSELLEEGREEEAGKVAGAVFALLAAVAGGLSLVGILLAPLLVDLFLPGFEGLRRDLTVLCTRIIFPMTGVLVLYAWGLGILNSHRRFFLSYVAPVVWNAAIIGAIVFFGGRLDLSGLTVAAAWGALLGGVLQFLVLLPAVLRLERELRIRWDTRLEGVRTAVRNAGPAIAGRGVVQISGYVDIFLASWLVGGAVSALTYAQTLYLLPISLFGMSIAAAELPELARRRTAAEAVLRQRVVGGLRRIAFLVVPSLVAFLTIGDVLVAAIFQGGRFEAGDTLLVYLVLAGYSVGLLASTSTRLYSSAFFALRDTRTPAKVAGLRVIVSAALGVLLMLLFSTVAVGDKNLGPAGLSLAAGLAAWMEWAILSRSLRSRIGRIGFPLGAVARMLLAALAAGAAGRGLAWLLPDLHPVVTGAAVTGAFGIVYFAVASLLGLDEVSTTLRRALGRVRRAG